jgi:hypothetical protein
MHSAAQHERGCSAGLRPAPAPSWSNSNSRSWFPVESRGGSGCGGRCRYVHVSSVAASMRLTPPQPDPPRLRQISAVCGSTPFVDESLSDIEINRGSDPFSNGKGVYPQAIPHAVPRTHPTVTGKLSKAGRCRIAGCPRHGCRDQAPMDGFTASPQSDTALPNPQTTQSRFGFGFGFGFRFGFGRCRAQPCRPTLPCARKRFHCFQQTVIPSPRQYHIAEQHAPAGDPC